MLTSKDIQNIVMWRDELTANRTVPIALTVTQEGERHPVTGEVTEGTTTVYEVDSVVTERASRIDNERKREADGGSYIDGDLWFSVSYDQIEAIRLDMDADDGAKFLDAFKEVEYDDMEYVVTGTDKKGVGVFNRVEFLAKRKT